METRKEKRQRTTLNCFQPVLHQALSRSDKNKREHSHSQLQVEQNPKSKAMSDSKSMSEH